MDPTTFLEVRALTKVFGHRKVVDGVNLRVNPGEIVGLLGRNGAGKTTTFRMVIGILRPTAGSVFFRGEDVTRLTIYSRVHRGIGYLSQERSVFQRLSVEENVLAVVDLKPGHREEWREKARKLLGDYGLTKVARQKAHTLSGGESRRLEICRAMILDPHILMLDEPFSGVDPIGVTEIQGFIEGLRAKGISVLLTDHNVRETLRICDRVYIINDGQVLKSGTPSEVAEDRLVRNTYLGNDFRM